MHPNLDPEFATLLLSPAGRGDHKYTRGQVGFVTGSTKYPGAALLGINAAFELQVGMVQYLGPADVAKLVLSNRPEVVLGLDGAQALVLGSGISKTQNGVQLKNLKASAKLDLPMVIDAGALELLDLEFLTGLKLLTPHPGEAELLFARFGKTRHRADIAANMSASAQELAELSSAVVLLKGSMSVLAMPGELPIESGPGSPHLATAGTGDVLAGMIGALMAKHASHGETMTQQSLRDIALLANQLHSEAAEVAAAKGRFGASAICRAISEAITV
jgi:ADP-dependent NAD(P)H-hydrate dehydratase / NAD(P)H-hydrate epimerase